MCFPSWCILQMDKLGIYTGIPKSTPKLSHPCCSYPISKVTCLPHQSNVSIEHLDPDTRFHPNFSFFNNFFCQKFLPPSPLLMPPPSPSLYIPQYHSVHHSNSPGHSSSSTATMATISPYSVLIKVVIFPDQYISCNYVFTIRSLSKPLVSMPLQ